MSAGTGARLARAAAVSGISTFSALALHVLAGGMHPAAPGIVVPLVVAFAAAWRLVGPSLSRARVATAVFVGQIAFHFLFTLGAGSASPLPVGLGDPHAGHVARTVTEASTANPHLHHGGPAMPVAHAIAGLVTYVALRRAQMLVDAVVFAGRVLAHAARCLLTPASALPLVAFAAPRRIDDAHTSPRIIRRAVTAVGLRAPPAFV